MPRTSLVLVILAPVLVFSVLSGDTSAQQDRGFSVEVMVPDEQSPEEKIASLQEQIAAKTAAGELTPELGDLFNDLGVAHAQLEQWPEARMAFIQAVQTKPYDADFHRNLALVAIRLEDYDLALVELEEYRKRGGAQAVDAHRRIARVYKEMGDIEAARSALERGLGELGREPSAEVCKLALELAALEDEHGDSQTVRDVLEAWQPVARQWRDQAEQEGIVDGVEEAEAIEAHLLARFIEDGQLLEDSGLPIEAAELYEKAYDLAPDRHEILPRLVEAYVQAGQTMQARVRTRMARREHPEAAPVWLATAKVYEAEHQQAEAIDAYRQAYEIAPETPGLRLKLGNMYMRAGEDAEARKYLAEAIQAPDTPTEVIYNYAVSLMRDDKFRAATRPLERVTRERPDFAGGWIALAQCYRARRQYSRAVDAYEEAFTLRPDPAIAYNLGVTAGRAGQWTRAVAAYDQALELAPGNLEAEYNRAVALMRSGDLEAAAEAFAAFRERDPEHYRASLNHGVTLYKLGRYDEAVSVYNITLELNETAEAWDNLGLAYQGLGDEKKAQACFKEAQAMRGES
ncbi:tetratricopeptide repeat protein [bacterium]|nr:tetratricopeptide repeat protein [bacterium]